MSLSLIALPGAEACADRLATKLEAALCRLEHRRFADGEQYLRVADDVQGRDVVVVAQLRNPDPQLPALLFLADALRELGARGVGLVAPYLPYMRQDARFRPGEAVTSRSVAKWISSSFDWLATVDPHLHRFPTLDALYKLPSAAVPSAAAVALWIHGHVSHPCIVGPDEESEQWVAQVANLARCPYTVLGKRRLSDRQVELRLPDLAPLRGHTPVLVDDIIASAHTMAEAVGRLRAAGLPPAVCVGVHAVFAGDAADLLRRSGAARVVTCNTLAHPSNAIDVSEALAEAVRMLRFEHPSQGVRIMA
ncbi:MAG TPA: ribose-phosphate diphosphokinase [Albitalea sp.]|nr:ribose-phosphate diphosphokinase [Albitalea sp.]